MGKRIARLTTDGVLKYREDAFIWKSAAGRAQSSSKYQFVKVVAPVNATQKQIIDAINQKSVVGKMTTTDNNVNVSSHGSVTIAWELTGKASPIAPWGLNKKSNQSLYAHS